MVYHIYGQEYYNIYGEPYIFFRICANNAGSEGNVIKMFFIFFQNTANKITYPFGLIFK